MYTMAEARTITETVYERMARAICVTEGIAAIVYGTFVPKSLQWEGRWTDVALCICGAMLAVLASANVRTMVGMRYRRRAWHPVLLMFAACGALWAIANMGFGTASDLAKIFLVTIALCGGCFLDAASGTSAYNPFAGYCEWHDCTDNNGCTYCADEYLASCEPVELRGVGHCKH